MNKDTRKAIKAVQEGKDPAEIFDGLLGVPSADDKKEEKPQSAFSKRLAGIFSANRESFGIREFLSKMGQFKARHGNKKNWTEDETSKWEHAVEAAHKASLLQFALMS